MKPIRLFIKFLTPRAAKAPEPVAARSTPQGEPDVDTQIVTQNGDIVVS